MAKKITLELTVEELQLIYDVFESKTKESLLKWTEYISQKNIGTESNLQWALTGMYHDIMYKSGIALGKFTEKENIPDELNLESFNRYKKVCLELKKENK